MVEILVIIPARGGSKGIPRKNIKSLGGHPLIAYSIAAAQQSELASRIIVSTDDTEIARIAEEYGAEVPFLRPDRYAQDDTRDLPVFQHALAWLAKEEQYLPELVVQLRPTSPFRPPGLIDSAIRIMMDNPQASSVRGVVPSKQNPYKMWKYDPDGPLSPLLVSDYHEPYNMPRQELPTTYWQTGHIDVIRAETIQNGSMSGDVVYPCLIEPRFSVDLDNQLDWGRAQDLLAVLGNEIVLPGAGQRKPLENISLLVLDFDGVLTDDRVYVNQHGEETVAAHRGDGMGISLARKAGLEVVILSTEKNPVVQARAGKLNIPVYQGVENKDLKIEQIIGESGVAPEQVAFIGNDINDLPCFPLVGLAVCVADSHPEVLRRADLILSRRGGEGAVREFIDLVLGQQSPEPELED